MVEVKVGQELDFSTKKCGQGQRGAWCLFNIKADKGSNRITIWATNAEDASNFTSGRVKSVDSIRYGAKKGTDGTWYPDVSANCTIEGVDSNAVNKSNAYDKFMAGASEFMDIPEGDALPFN